MNRSLEPSGDHSGAPAPSGIEVIRRASPPSTDIVQSCGLASFSSPALRSDTNTSVRPSGENRGDESVTSAKVSCSARPPL
jgi:hypothetical protein